MSSTQAGGASAEIKFPDAAYCLDERNGHSDHRPVVATLPDFLGTIDAVVNWKRSAPDAETPAALEEMEFRPQPIQRPGDSVGY